MKTRLLPRRRTTRVALLLIAAALLPYLSSRVMSPWRRIDTFRLPKFSASEFDADDGKLRVACYNIAHGRGPTATSNWDGGSPEVRVERLESISDLLKEVNADIVILNEVDFDSSWSNGVNQARFLAQHAGYPYWLEQRNLDFRFLTWRWRFGNAVLSKYPIEEPQIIDLPGYSGLETVLAGKKDASICSIQVGHHPVRIVAAHLSHRSESLRVKSIEAILGECSNRQQTTIIAGDMNSTPTGFPKTVSDDKQQNAMDVLDASGQFERSPQRLPLDSDQYTFHTQSPRSVIDWILVPKSWHYENYQVHTSKLSDHRLVYADIIPLEESQPSSE